MIIASWPLIPLRHLCIPTEVLETVVDSGPSSFCQVRILCKTLPDRHLHLQKNDRKKKNLFATEPPTKRKFEQCEKFLGYICDVSTDLCLILSIFVQRLMAKIMFIFHFFGTSPQAPRLLLSVNASIIGANLFWKSNIDL